MSTLSGLSIPRFSKARPEHPPSCEIEMRRLLVVVDGDGD
jgi:hypothetical protein